MWCRKGEAFCERAFALYRQQPENEKQEATLPPLENFLRTPMRDKLD